MQSQDGSGGRGASEPPSTQDVTLAHGDTSPRQQSTVVSVPDNGTGKHPRKMKHSGE